MSLLNNSNKKKKGSKAVSQQNPKGGSFSAKAKASSKAHSRNTKLTGGSQRGS
jgi:hypothetical protein